MVSLKDRKEHTDKVYATISGVLNKITQDPKKSGFLLFLVHWIFIGIPTVYILFGEVDSKFFACCLVYIIVFLLHFYFGGCILTRIERKLWNTKHWYGPSTFFFLFLDKIGVNMTNERMNYVYLLNAVFITIIITVRILSLRLS